MKFYLIGIKGTGMAALAGILVDDGHEVRGNDIDHIVRLFRKQVSFCYEKRQIQYTLLLIIFQ